MFGLTEEIMTYVKKLHSEYIRMVELDGKPEKGERKLADDLPLLINEMLEKEKKEDLIMYRIGLLEYASGKSPYNFDIQLQLLKLFDQLGLSASFQ